MQIHSIGIALGKTTLPLMALGAAGKVLEEKKLTQKQLLAYTPNLQMSLIGWRHSRGSLLWPNVAQAGPRCSVDCGSVREAVCEVQQERLCRCRGDC